MSFARSYYADTKPKTPEQVPEQSVEATVAPPAPEVPLSPAQVQDAIRLYRQLQSGNISALSPLPQPVLEEPEPAKTPVNSDYYGVPGGIPQSYLTNYSTPKRSPAPPRAQIPASPRPQSETDQQILARLQALTLQQQYPQQYSVSSPRGAQRLPTAPPPSMMQSPSAPRFSQPQAPPTPSRAQAPPATRIAYGAEESGYAFDRQPKREAHQNAVEVVGVYPEGLPIVNEPAPEPARAYEPPVNPYTTPASFPTTEFNQKVQNGNFKLGQSQYIGMANDNVFIYDAQQNKPNNYAEYTLVNAEKPVQTPVTAPTETTQRNETTTEDTYTDNRLPYSPAPPVPQSRFRGLIREATTPIVVTPIEYEAPAHRIAQVPYHRQQFNDINSEYQLGALNDLASCIE